MNSAGGYVRKSLKRGSIRLFMEMDRIGVHVLPKHYYTPVADYRWLRQNKPLWQRRVDMTGVDWNLHRQLEWLDQHCSEHYHEVRRLESYSQAMNAGYGLGFGPIESQVLHCVCRTERPRRIVEVGSGVSTACTWNAIRRNDSETGQNTQLICIEPLPSVPVRDLPGVQLLKTYVQEVPVELFSELDAGDSLFIDSSHSVKTGSDVTYLLLEIVPRLRPGVLVHIHDVFLPYLYQRNLLEHYFDWQETAMLLALLKGNSNLRVLCCLSALHYDAREDLRRILSDYEPQQDSEPGLSNAASPGHFPASIWLRTGSGS